MSIIKNIQSILDPKKFTEAVLIDFRKAFDTADEDILIN